MGSPWFHQAATPAMPSFPAATAPSAQSAPMNFQVSAGTAGRGVGYGEILKQR